MLAYVIFHLLVGCYSIYLLASNRGGARKFSHWVHSLTSCENLVWTNSNFTPYHNKIITIRETMMNRNMISLITNTCYIKIEECETYRLDEITKSPGKYWNNILASNATSLLPKNIKENNKLVPRKSVSLYFM